VTTSENNNSGPNNKPSDAKKYQNGNADFCIFTS
jgi:hypothetical protein